MRDWAPRRGIGLKFDAQNTEQIGVEVLTTTREPVTRRLNGGFPEPHGGLNVRLVRVDHRGCGGGTMIRVPVEVPDEAIRRVVCSGCQESFAPRQVQALGVLDAATRKPSSAGAGAYNSVPMRERPDTLTTLLENAYINQPEVGPGISRRPAAPEKKPRRRRPSVSLPSRPRVSMPKLSRPSLPSLPKPAFSKLSISRPSITASVALPRVRRPSLPKLRLPRLGRGESVIPSYAAIPIAFAAVVVGIIAIQGWNASTRVNSPTTPAPAVTSSAPATSAPATPAAAGANADAGSAKIVRGTNFTIALPAGWEETTPPNGATFAAAATDSSANATLWIQNEPSLDYPTFEARSLAQLRALAGSAHIANRVIAPTADATVVHLAADTPAGTPAYQATLRVSGPYRYYLATSVEPDASTTGKQGAELLSNSLTPVDDGVSK